tara:strand:+ start:937 stop:1614 length:678 start_codon:yes stop_codon:yes gene_type:complete
MKKKSPNEIKELLDTWVASVGSGRYVPGNYTENLDQSFSITENFGIQQVRAEIHEFIDILLKQKKLENCLEIGLGFYGSTHFLWRLLFNKTITIEYQKDRVFKFGENMNSFNNKFMFKDMKSSFIFGSSHDPSSVEKLEKILKGKKLDLLFIDGDHNYKSVLSDWLLYKEFVVKGGIIAFDDCESNCNNYGVKKVLKKIKSFDNSIKIKKIIKSKNQGIAYYYKK